MEILAVAAQRGVSVSRRIIRGGGAGRDQGGAGKRRWGPHGWIDPGGVPARLGGIRLPAVKHIRFERVSDRHRMVDPGLPAAQSGAEIHAGNPGGKTVVRGIAAFQRCKVRVRDPVNLKKERNILQA